MIWRLRSLTRQLWFEHGSGVAICDGVSVALQDSPKIAGIDGLVEVRYISRQREKARLRQAGYEWRTVTDYEIELLDAALLLMRTQGRAALGL